VKGNKAFIFGRQGMATGSEQWDVCFVCAGLADQNVYRRGGGTVIPLHLAGDEGGLGFDDTQVNFSREVIQHFAAFNASPEVIFNFAYAVFYSPTYRVRYAEFLKIDFPRLPPTKNHKLFEALAKIGAELIALHLMDSPKLAKFRTNYIGGSRPEVEKISWTQSTVWIDKAQTTGFRGVPEAVWNFQIGGYQVCEKWLKDRKGRALTKDDINHYQAIVVALSETIRLMTEIDEVIGQNGGWPIS
jgi:predicted helicase